MPGDGGKSVGLLLFFSVLGAIAMAAPSSATVPGADGAGGETYPSHEPIRITSDAELALPDQVADNGVRGGSGTEEDPYRIERWTIEPGQEPAIVVTGTINHVVISEIEIVPPEPDEVPPKAIRLSDAENVTIEGLAIVGWPGPTLTVYGGEAKVQDVRIQGAAPAETIRAGNATLDLDDVRVANVTDGMAVANTKLAITDSTFRGVGTALRIPEDREDGEHRGSVRIVNTTFVGGEDPQYGSYVLSTRSVQTGGYVLADNRFEDWTAAIRFEADGENRGSSFDVLVRNNTFDGNAQGIKDAREGRPWDAKRIAGNIFEQNHIGVRGGGEQPSGTTRSPGTSSASSSYRCRPGSIARSSRTASKGTGTSGSSLPGNTTTFTLPGTGGGIARDPRWVGPRRATTTAGTGSHRTWTRNRWPTLRWPLRLRRRATVPIRR